MAVKPRTKSSTGGYPAPGSSTKPTPKKKPVKKKPAPTYSSTPTRPPATTPAVTPAATTSALPTDPMAPLSPAQMQQQAVGVAMAQLQPQQNLINQQQAMGQQAHDTRLQQSQGWADWQQKNLDAAFSATRDATNSLMATTKTNDQASSDSLAAALRQESGQTDAAASLIGGMPRPTDLSGVLDANNRQTKSGELGIQNAGITNIANAGGLSTLGSVGLGQRQDEENQRWNAENKGYSKQASDLTATLPNLIKSTLKDQGDFELAKAQFGETKANNLFQQYLADKTLNHTIENDSFTQWLNTQQLGETIRSNKAGETISAAGVDETVRHNTSQEAIDWANVGVSRTQVEGQLAQIKSDAAAAKDTATRAKIEERGKAWRTALTALGEFMMPTPEEASSGSHAYPYGKATHTKTNSSTGAVITPAKKVYQRLYNDAYNKLLSYVSQSDALRILSHSEYSDWRKKASADLKKLKRRPMTNRLDDWAAAKPGSDIPNVTATP